MCMIQFSTHSLFCNVLQNMTAVWCLLAVLEAKAVAQRLPLMMSVRQRSRKVGKREMDIDKGNGV